MVDLVNLSRELFSDVMAEEFKIGVIAPLLKVALLSREQRIHDNHLMALFHETVDKMGADETRSTSHEDTLVLVRAVRCITTAPSIANALGAVKPHY